MGWPKGKPRKPAQTLIVNSDPSPRDGWQDDLPPTPTAQALCKMMGQGVLSDEQIRALCRVSLPDPMISPYSPTLISREPAQGTHAQDPDQDGRGDQEQDDQDGHDDDDDADWHDAREGREGHDPEGARVASYGTSSSGYDVRLGREFMVFDPSDDILDPLAWDDRNARRVEADEIIIPRGGFVLAHTVERFRIPRDLMALCVGKSTFARCGLIVNVTPIESGFDGQITIEITNTGARPVKLRAGQGIAQFVFLRTASPVRVSYADRKGKYQGQHGVTPPR